MSLSKELANEPLRSKARWNLVICAVLCVVAPVMYFRGLEYLPSLASFCLSAPLIAMAYLRGVIAWESIGHLDEGFSLAPVKRSRGR
jgi:glucose-6-phosphate-specific signal transduction histidine kinase